MEQREPTKHYGDGWRELKNKPYYVDETSHGVLCLMIVIWKYFQNCSYGMVVSTLDLQTTLIHKHRISSFTATTPHSDKSLPQWILASRIALRLVFVFVKSFRSLIAKYRLMFGEKSPTLLHSCEITTFKKLFARTAKGFEWSPLKFDAFLQLLPKLAGYMF